jgi:predicted dehydrogenase
MWLGLPEVEIVGVADPNAKGLEAARKKMKDAPGFGDYRQMLAEAKPEIVAICPRDIEHHLEMALAAVQAGARGVYIEKAFCRTPTEADQIIAACEKTGARLAVAHRNRYHPALAAVKRAVEEGAIGKMLEVRCRGKEDARGGALDLWVLGSHIFNLVNYLAGKPAACSAVLLKGDRPATREDVQSGAEGVGPIAGDRLHARYEMDSGIPVYFDSIKGAGVRTAGFGLQLIGSAGLIDLRVDVQPLAHFVPGNPFQPDGKPRPWVPISSAGIGKPEPIADLSTQVANHVLPARDLIAAINEKRAPLCSAQEGLTTVEMITAAFASHVRDGARVTFPLAMRENALAKWGQG